MRWILVDRLLECVPGERAVAVKTFPRSDLLFTDHFAGFPTVPGVLQVEMIAQTAGRCIRIARPDVLTMLGVVRSAKFFRRVEPGDVCRISVEILKLRDAYALQSGVVEVDGVRVAQAELVAAIVPAPVSPAPDPVVEEWRQRLERAREHDPLEEGARPAAH